MQRSLKTWKRQSHDEAKGCADVRPEMACLGTPCPAARIRSFCCPVGILILTSWGTEQLACTLLRHVRHKEMNEGDRKAVV